MKKYFNSQVVYDQKPSLIDKDKGIIKDIVVAKTGEAKGHDLFLDEPFIADVESLGNESEIGIKARFGHPNICSTALGTYLGRYKNFRTESIPHLGGTKGGSKVIADLHLDKSAIKSPKGNLYGYILDLAETNPEMFGASIAFKTGKEKVQKMEEDGKQFNRRYATIKSLYAIDFVDDPAVTDGLFEAFHEDDFAFQVSSFLDSHPDIFKLLDSKPEIFESFMSNYKIYNEKKSMNLKEEIQNLKSWVSENFSGKNPTEGFEKEVNDRITTLETEIDEVLSAKESLSQLILTKDNEIAELQSKLNRSLANPTLPDKNSDPLLSIENKKTTDFTGKVILDNIPSTMRRKLKTQ